MLMDLFFEVAPVSRKRRVHFHAFMQEIQDRLHDWRQRSKGARSDPLPELAGEIAAETWLLCFDEFHVVNIADAMILSRLFEGLFGAGVVVVATSNWPPDRLYEGGLQRENFLPFVELLKGRLDILLLDSGVDYRLDRIKAIEIYHAPLGPRASAALDESFQRLTEGARAAPEAIAVKGRKIPVTIAARGVARFSFAELCEAPLGPGDYLTIARRYHTLILSDVPRLDQNKRNEARRFMTLIDALYEHRVKLIIAGRCPAEAALSRRRWGLRVRTHRQPASGNALGRVLGIGAPHGRLRTRIQVNLSFRRKWRRNRQGSFLSFSFSNPNHKNQFAEVKDHGSS